MRRAVLLFNPLAGRASADRRQHVEAAAVVLREHGFAVEIEPTRSAASAGEQASTATSRGADVVFACGGDGTVHGILQGLVGRPGTSLGILPMGSGNALARHLCIPLDPVRAALEQVQRAGVLASVGRVWFQTPGGVSSRYFAVMAGAGPDGLLVYRSLATGKDRLGRTAYYLHALRLLATHRFVPFQCVVGEGTRAASSMMCVRVGDLGGVFSPLIRGGSWSDRALLVNLVRPPAPLSFPLWWVMAGLRLDRWNPLVQSAYVLQARCGAGARPVQVQADGEWLGRTPMRLEIVPDAVRLLVPTTRTQ